MFKRGLSEVKLLNREIHRVSEDYISPEDELHFEDELRQKDYTEYCLYLLIKIHHFLEVVHGIRVLKMGADFAKDEAGTIWLLNISRVEHKQLDVVLRDEAPARNPDGLLNYDDSPDGFVQEIEGTYKENERKNSIKLLNNILKQHYENIKRILGVDILEAYYEETINDEVFTKLHPNAPFKLSDIPRSNIVYEEIREFIIHNSRKLLYPNLSAEKEMTPEVLAKYSFSGNVPKSMIGVVVKKSEQANPNKNKNEISLPKLNESKTRSYSPMRNISKSLASINKAHLGIKTAFSGNLKSTWWNLKPAIRSILNFFLS